MALALSIALGILGAATVMVAHSVAGDIVGGALAIGALIALTRSVIRLAGDAGAPSDAQVSSAPGSSPEATSRLR
jgi:hypothetical protein